MNQLHKKLIAVLIVVGAIVVLCASMPYLSVHSDSRVTNIATVAPMANEPIQFSVLDAGQFKDKYEGVYLCRPETVHANNVYMLSVGTDNLIGSAVNFESAIYQAWIRKNDDWERLPGKGNEDFWFDDQNDSSEHSVFCYLRESAPAAVYAISCSYDDATHDEPVYFKIVYTEYWTYVNVTNNDGERRTVNWNSGKTLELNVTFNDGAADPSLSYTDQTIGSTGVRYGAISNSSNIVSLDNMDITVKTVSGKVFPTKNLVCELDSNVKNRVKLQFTNALENDIYLVQFTSKANNRIVGQFVIDNSAQNSGVNLSQLWAILMIFGGVLAIGAASAYLVPFFIVKINGIRADNENERIARMKNPENFAKKKDKKSFKEMVNNVVYKIKTPAYKRQEGKEEEQEVPTEEKVYTNRFTEMLRERQEKRDYMREHNVSSVEMEKMKEAEAAAAADEANSFAALRDDDDDDDEIATFHAAEDDVSTLETGSYVQDGATFAKLDSLRANEIAHGDDGNNENDE